jgi:CheY-like chemotaxis protein
MLSRLGYTADLAPDGQRTLDAIENAEYDLILMDIQMPTMNGIDAARLIREKLGAKCPVIFALTAEALEGDKERFLGLGFDGYLSKPVQTHTLQATLRTINSRPELGVLRPAASSFEKLKTNSRRRLLQFRFGRATQTRAWFPGSALRTGRRRGPLSSWTPMGCRSNGELSKLSAKRVEWISGYCFHSA